MILPITEFLMYGSYGGAGYGAATPTSNDYEAAKSRLLHSKQILAQVTGLLKSASKQVAIGSRGAPTEKEIYHLQKSVHKAQNAYALALAEYTHIQDAIQVARTKGAASVDVNAAAAAAAAEAVAADLALQVAQKEAAALQAAAVAEAVAFRAAAAAAATEQQKNLYMQQLKREAAAEALSQPTFATEIPQYSVDLEEWDAPDKVTTMRSQKKPNYLLWGLGALVLYRVIK